MVNLHPLILERLKTMLSSSPKRALTMDEKIQTLDTLRSEVPDLFSNLTEEQLKDNNFLVKFLTNPYNKNKIKTALKKELSTTQQTEIFQAIDEQPITEGSISGQATGQAGASSSEAQFTGTSSSFEGGMPFGMPGGGASGFSAPRIIHNVPQAEKPDIAIANSSGHVNEAGDPSKLVKTTSTGQIKEAGNPSQLVTANSSGAIREAGNPSKLVSTSGRPISSGTTFRDHSIKNPSAFSNFRSNLGSKVNIGLNKGINKAFSGINNFGRGGGAGSRSIFGRFGRGSGKGFLGGIGRGGGGRAGSIIGKAKSRWKLAILGLLFPMMLVGMLTIPSSSSTVTPSGNPIQSSDISNCKFTRASSTAQLKSSILTGWISSTASKFNIPSAVLASVVYHENPGLFPEDDNHDAFKNDYYYFVNPDGDTKAIGLSQIAVGKTPIKDKDGNTIIVDHCKALLSPDGAFQKAAAALGKKIFGPDYYCVENTNERIQKFCQTDKILINSALYAPPDNNSNNDYLNLCRITDNLAVGAAMLNGKLGNGSWDNSTDLQGAIRGYYGACDYPGGNYCTEVVNDFQNCKTTTPPASGTAPIPINNAYTEYAKAYFNVDVSALPDPYPQWAAEALQLSFTTAPKFQSLLAAKSLTTVIPVDSGSHTEGDTIYIRKGYDADFFKQIFIHELGHRIKGPAGAPSPACPDTGETIEVAEANEKYLTYYGEHATPPDVKSPACGNNNTQTQSDEDFADSVSYYIINPMRELNYGSGCSTYNQALGLPESTNPYARTKEVRPRHKGYMKCLLGP